jgi:hypothetical protein
LPDGGLKEDLADGGRNPGIVDGDELTSFAAPPPTANRLWPSVILQNGSVTYGRLKVGFAFLPAGVFPFVAAWHCVLLRIYKIWARSPKFQRLEDGLLRNYSREEHPSAGKHERAAVLITALNFAAALAGLIAAYRWYQTTNIKPPTELSLDGSATVDAGPLVAFVTEIGQLNRRAASWTAVAALMEGLATIAHHFGV